jgi:hypothetical protein
VDLAQPSNKKGRADNAFKADSELASGFDMLDLTLVGSDNEAYDIRFVFDPNIGQGNVNLRDSQAWADHGKPHKNGELYFLDRKDNVGKKNQKAQRKIKPIDRPNFQYRIDYYFTVVEEAGSYEQLIEPAPRELEAFHRQRISERTVDCSANPILDPSVKPDAANIDQHLRYKIDMAVGDIPDIVAELPLQRNKEITKIERFTEEQWIGTGINPRQHLANSRSQANERKQHRDRTQDLPAAPVTMIFSPITSHPIYDCHVLNETMVKNDRDAFLCRGVAHPRPGPHKVSTHAGAITPRIAELGLRSVHHLTLMTEAQRLLYYGPAAVKNEEEDDDKRVVKNTPIAGFGNQRWMYSMLTRVSQLSTADERFGKHDTDYFVVDCLEGALLQLPLEDESVVEDASVFNLHGCASTIFWLLMDRRFQKTIGLQQWRWAAECFLDLSLLDACMPNADLRNMIARERKGAAAGVETWRDNYLRTKEPSKLSKFKRDYFIWLHAVFTKEMEAKRSDDNALSVASAAHYTSLFRRAMAGVLLIFAERLGVIQSFYLTNEDLTKLGARAWRVIKASCSYAYTAICQEVKGDLWRKGRSALIASHTLSQTIYNFHSFGVLLQVANDNTRLIDEACITFLRDADTFARDGHPVPPATIGLQHMWFAYLDGVDPPRPVPLRWQRGIIRWLKEYTLTDQELNELLWSNVASKEMLALVRATPNLVPNPPLQFVADPDADPFWMAIGEEKKSLIWIGMLALLQIRVLRQPQWTDSRRNMLALACLGAADAHRLLSKVDELQMFRMYFLLFLGSALKAPMNIYQGVKAAIAHILPVAQLGELIKGHVRTAAMPSPVNMDFDILNCRYFVPDAGDDKPFYLYDSDVAWEWFLSEFIINLL